MTPLSQIAVLSVDPCSAILKWNDNAPRHAQKMAMECFFVVLCNVCSCFLLASRLVDMIQCPTSGRSENVHGRGAGGEELRRLLPNKFSMVR